MAPHVRFRPFILLATVVWALASHSAFAAVHNVTNGNDAGPGSWRQAVLDAAADVDSVVIDFTAGLKVQLTSADVVYPFGGTQPMTVNGNGSTIDGGAQFRILDVAANSANASITLNDLILRRGRSPTQDGGAIRAGFDISVNRCVLLDNESSCGGGALYSDFGDIVVHDSLFVGNVTSCRGGAIGSLSGNLVRVTESRFYRNSAGTGGAIGKNGSGTVEIEDSEFIDNIVDDLGGGALGFDGSNIQLSVLRSRFHGNRAGTPFVASSRQGGAIYFASGNGSLDVEDSAFHDNYAGCCGGAIFSNSPLQVRGSTFASNFTESGGGGISVRSTASATVTNSTFTANRAYGGNAIEIAGNNNNVMLLHNTFASNETLDGGAGNGAHVYLVGSGGPPGPLTAFGNVFADPIGDINCRIDGSKISLGYNYQTDDSCGLTAGTGDVVDGVDPQVLALAYYGGPTRTRRPAQGSPLIDAIALADCHSTVLVDQRGVARPQGSACTIGAVEIESAAALIAVATPDRLPGGGGVSSEVQVSLRNASGAPLSGQTVSFSVAAGAGNVMPVTAVTNSNGEASTTYASVAADSGGTVEINAVAGALGAVARIDVDRALSFVVTHGGDGGAGSYRQAIADAAEAIEPAVVVIVMAGLLVELDSGDVVYDGTLPITLRGESAGPMLAKAGAPVGSAVLDGGGAHRILLAEAAPSVEVVNLILQNGNADLGGAVYTDAGDIEVVDSTLSGNSAFEGGALYTEFGSVRLRGVQSTSNSAVDGAGGVVYAANDVIIVEASSFESNYADDKGGALYAITGTISVRDATFAGNSAVYAGGAINGFGDITVINSTLLGNTATDAFGGAIFAGTLDLRHVTLTGNAAALGAQVYTDGDMRAFATLFADPVGGNNCAVDAVSLGYNYDTGDSCGLAESTDTVFGGDPLLLPLADNGGPTATRLPDPDSPLVDAIPTQDCDPDIAADQRGVARPQRAGCDIGAVELGELPEAIFADGFE